MKYSYSNLVGLVLLTIIIIVVIQAVSIRSRIVYKEGLDTGPTPSRSKECSNTPNAQKIVKNVLGEDSYSDCTEIQGCIDVLKQAGIRDDHMYTDLTNILSYARDRMRITKVSDALLVLRTLVNEFPNTKPIFNIMIIIISDFGIRSPADFTTFVGMVKTYNLKTNNYNVLPIGNESDNRCLTNLILRTGGNYSNLKQILETSKNKGILTNTNVDEYYQMLIIMHNINFTYSATSNSNTLSDLVDHANNDVVISADCKTGSTMLRKMCSLEKIIKGLVGSNWPSYISSVDSVKRLAGIQIDLPGAVEAFRNYWNEGCTSDGKKDPDNPAETLYKKLTWTPNTLAQMLYLMNFINTHSGKDYFHHNTSNSANHTPHTGSTDLRQFWKLVNQKYTIYQLVEQAKTGSTAYKFVTSHGKDGFESMSPPTFLESISNMFTRVKDFLVGRETIETMETNQIADEQVLVKFGITKGSELAPIQTSMQAYIQNTRLSETNSDWDNMIKLMSVFTNVGVTSVNWEKCKEIMKNFAGNDVNIWVQVLDSMAQLNISAYEDFAEFIEILTSFRVKYNTNFKVFMQVLKAWGFDIPPGTRIKNTIMFENFKLFIRDMQQTLGYTYESNSTQVNTIISFLTMSLYKLQHYTIVSIPRNLIINLQKHSSLAKLHPNGLKDILQYTQIQPGYTTNMTIQEAVKNIMIHIDKKPEDVIAKQLTYITSFLFTAEFDSIVNKTFDSGNILRTMQSISAGMARYNLTTNNIEKPNYEKVQQILSVFPHTGFQYISDQISTNAGTSNAVGSALRVSVNQNGAANNAALRPQVATF